MRPSNVLVEHFVFTTTGSQPEAAKLSGGSPLLARQNSTRSISGSEESCLVKKHEAVLPADSTISRF
jgi:hypothetical protein